MGMFDDVRCDYPLPTTLELVDLGIDVNSLGLQTKDLNCGLDLYIVDDEGRLIYKNVVREWREDESAFFKGYMAEVSHTMDEIKYHGIIDAGLYETIEEEDKQTTVLVSYNFKFTDGKLVDIEMTEHSIEDTTDRMLEFNSMMGKVLNARRKWYNRYFLSTRPVYWVRRKVIKVFYKIHELTGKVYSLVSRSL